MALKPPAFPDSAAITATTLAVVAVGYVLTAIGPQVRNVRELQRAWNDAKTAAQDAFKKLERLPAAMEKAQQALGSVDKLEPNTAVLKLKRTKADVAAALSDFDLALLAVDTVRTKVLGLRKFRTYIIQSRPDFDDMLAEFDAKTASVEEVRSAIESLRDANVLEQFDQAIELAVETATAYAMARSLHLAKTRPRRTVEEALESLKRVHDFARAHGEKLGA